MARSSCIYVVYNNNLLIGGYTVKYEMTNAVIDFCIRYPNQDGIKCYRISDGGDLPRIFADITDEVMDKVYKHSET